MIDHLTTETLDTLIVCDSDVCVSIYLPMERRGAETQANPLRLKAAYKEAAERLAEKEMRRPDVEGALEPVARLIDDHDFWQHQEDGLAIFIDGEDMLTFRLPIAFDELVVVGSRLHIKPLLPFLASDGEFYVLALSHNEVRLLRGSRWRVSEVELHDVPKSLRDALWYKEAGPALQSHATSAGGALTFHGHGLGEESADEDLKEFFRQVDGGARSVVPDDRTPVVLAGVEYLHPLYRSISEMSVLEEGVVGNPEEMSATVLHERAWPIVRDVFDERRRAAADRIGAADTSSSLDDVLMGAAQGRVDTVFVPEGRQRWGTLDRETLEVRVTDEPNGTDLYDVAAVETWRHRGEVYVVAPDEMPGEGEIAAVFRY